MPTKISENYDIIVAGGGLAGVCAAIAAARELKNLKKENAKVALINDRPVLGGVSSSEIRVPPIGAGRNPWGFETGIISELLYEERARNHNRWEMGTANSVWDIVLWEAIKAETIITLYLNTTIRYVNSQETNGKKNIQSIYAFQLGNEKEFEMHAEQFIDCTGDSTVAYEAGAKLMTGRESKETHNEDLAQNEADDACMGSSLLFQAKDIGKPCPFKAPPYAAKYHSEESLYFRPHQNFKNGYYWIEVGVPFKTIEQNEEIRDELLKHVLGVWDHLKNHCTHFGKEVENWALDWVGMIPGKRGSRRIVGQSIVTEKDLRNMHLFEDRVAYGGHFFDLHTIGGILANDKPGNPVDTDPDLWDRCRLKPYPLPLSALYSVNCENLYMAGRNISTSHIANGSTRVMLTNALLGQAVGTAAAYSIKHKTTNKETNEIHIKSIQQSLLREGCFLHGLKNSDPADQTLQANISASSEGALNLEPIENEFEDWEKYRHKMNFSLGTVIPISTDHIEKIELWLESEENKTTEIELALFEIDHIWDIQNATKNLCKVTKTIQAKSSGYVTFDLNQKLMADKFYFITTSATTNDIYWRFRRDHPTGVFSVFQSPTSGFWKYLRHKQVEGLETFCLKVSPTQFPFPANNIKSGETKPFSKTNIWTSAITKNQPEWIKLNWQNPTNIQQIELTFDTDLSRTNETMPEFYISPKCVKDYEIKYLNEKNQSITLLEIKGNYQRRRVHQFKSITTSELEIIITKTNGEKHASIYEIRTY